MAEDRFSFRSDSKQAGGSDDQVEFGGNGGWNLASETNVQVENGSVLPDTGPLVPDSVIARWTFDEGDGTTATDAEGSHDGTITGATYTTDARAGSHALSFDGSGDYVDTGTNFKFATETGVFSVGGWVKLATHNDYNSLINNGDSSGTTWFRILTDANGQVRYNVRIDGTTNRATYDSIDTGTWYHLVMTADGSDLYGYVNGTRVVTEPISTTTSDPEGNFFVGDAPADTGNRAMDGIADDVMLANDTWTDQQVADIYNSY